MKSFLLASILLAGTPGFATVTTPATEVVAPQTQFTLGKTLVQQTRADYEAGKYSDFLADMDTSYKSAKSDNALEGLVEIRKTHAAAAPEQFTQGLEAIQKEKNNALLQLVKGQDGLFAEKVLSAIAMPSKQELAALEALSFMRTGAPGSGKNVDENQLLAIDLEYAYKAIHLDSLAASGKNIPDRKEKQLVLEMARMDKMLQASKSFENKALKAEVAILGERFDARLAKVADLTDLNLLAKGKLKAIGLEEQQVASILSTASQQLADLHRDVMNAELKTKETVQK